MSKSSVCSLIGVLLIAFSVNVLAAEPKHVNKNASFKKCSPSEELTLAKTKLGSLPKLSEKELKKIKAGKVVLRNSKEADGSRRSQAIAILDASPKAVMAFLKDYPAYPKYMPHMKKIEVSWDGNLAVNTYQLKIALSKINYKLNLLHYGNSIIEWEFIEGDIKDTNGYYKLHSYNEGTQTLVDYKVYTDAGMPLPGFIVNLLTRNSMPDVIEAIAKGVKDRSLKASAAIEK